MNGQLFVLDHTGHGTPASWGNDAASRKAARRQFETLAAAGYTMFRGEARDDGEKLTRFDPEAEVILAVPRMQGG